LSGGVETSQRKIALNRILVIRLSSIGDVLLVTPFLRILKQHVPDSDVDVVVRSEYAELLRWNPNVHMTHEFDVRSGWRGLLSLRRKLRDGGYTAVYDLHNSLRSRILRSWVGSRRYVVNKFTFRRLLLVRFKINLLRNAPPVWQRYIMTLPFYRDIDLSREDGELDLPLPANLLQSARERLADLGLKESSLIVGFAPGAKHNTKMWLEERFVELGYFVVKELNGSVVLFGGKEDSSRCARIAREIQKLSHSETAAINLCGELSLAQTAATMDYCQAIVSNDTGLMHIASARKRPLVAIFGPTVREFGFFPNEARSLVVQRSGLKCRPCSHIGTRSCPHGHFKCMREISTEMVAQALSKVLSVETQSGRNS